MDTRERRYPSDLTDARWSPMLPAAKTGRRPNVATAIALGIGPGGAVRAYGKTYAELRWAILTVMAVRRHGRNVSARPCPAGP
jgi:hypothetical protein